MNSKRTILCLSLLGLLSQPAGWAASVHVDLQPLFDADVVLELGGAGLTAPLDAERNRIDAATLPAAYADGSPIATQDGRASFKFGTLRQASLDAVTVGGQTLDVADLNYASVDLALLSAPNSYGDPFSMLEFRYTDGSQSKQRLGPVPGWFASPTAFDHTYYNYTDSSQVQTILSFATDWGDTEAGYLLQSRGNGNSGGNRFVDGTGYALYRLPLGTDLTAATFGITVGNNFVVSLATEFHDPDLSTTEGYTEVANSMTLYEGFEHRALGNLKLYEFDLAPFLAAKTGELYVLLTDATPANGWGPYLQNMRVFTGHNRVFEETLAPTLNTNGATVYAEFLTNGGDAERPYLYDNSGSGPSNRRHRFADAAGSITYRFDLPDAVTNAQLTIDMANNFVVSISGQTSLVRYAQVTPGTVEEKALLVDEGNSNLGGTFRFADGNAYMVYEFDLPDDVTTAVAQISVGNQFVVSLAAGENEFEVVKDWVAETGEETRDLANLKVYDFPLDSYLKNNPTKKIRIRLSDGQPGDGWGPYLTGITVVNQPTTGQQVFREVLKSDTLFAEDVHNERNKAYYTIDLSSVLDGTNPKKEVFVRFTDGSTADGWGPGVFWMALHSGGLEVNGDRSVFGALKSVNGEPNYGGVNLIYRRYALDSGKVLKEIVLPADSTLEASKVYLLGATLNSVQPSGSPELKWKVQSTGLQLSWPASPSGFGLQSAGSVLGPWSADSAPVVAQGTDSTVLIAPKGGPRFFRLVKQP